MTTRHFEDNLFPCAFGEAKPDCACTNCITRVSMDDAQIDVFPDPGAKYDRSKYKRQVCR